MSMGECLPDCIDCTLGPIASTHTHKTKPALLQFLIKYKSNQVWASEKVQLAR